MPKNKSVRARPKADNIILMPELRWGSRSLQVVSEPGSKSRRWTALLVWEALNLFERLDSCLVPCVESLPDIGVVRWRVPLVGGARV